MKGSEEQQKKKLSQNIVRAGTSVSGQVVALYSILCDTYGTDHLVLKASKLDALELLRSSDLGERVLGLQRVINEDPTLDTVPDEREMPGILESIQEKIADIIARRQVEDDLERRIMDKMQQRQDEYLEEIKMLVLKENSSSENAQTLKKLALLEKKEQTKQIEVRKTTVQANSKEELLDKIKNIDWDSIKPGENKIGGRFDFSV